MEKDILSILPSFAIFPKFEFNLNKIQFNDHNNEDFNIRASLFGRFPNFKFRPQTIFKKRVFWFFYFVGLGLVKVRIAPLGYYSVGTPEGTKNKFVGFWLKISGIGVSMVNNLLK